MTLLPLLLLGALLGLPALAQATHSVTLSCTPGVGGSAVTGFNALRSSTSGSGYVLIGSATTCNFTDSSTAVQTEGAKFFYVFQATGPGGVSPNSNEAAATIPFSVPAAPSGATAVPH
jgi:hypothetical protein